MTAVNGERPFLDGMLAAVTGRTEQDAFGRLAQSLVTAHSSHLSHLAGRVTVVEVQRFGLATTGATAAHRLAEQGLEIVDTATPQTANLANIQSKYRQWLAGKWNQQAYGEQKQQIAVQVNMNQAHLMASRVVDHVHAVNDHSNVIDVAPHNG